MTTARVIATSEISLNAVYYPLSKPIQPVLASQYPEKIILGDTTRDSNPHASVLSLSDWRGGLGMYQIGELGRVDRSWWSTCQLRYDNDLVLPGLATITAASGVAGTFTVGAIGELANEVYAAFGTSIRKYNNTTDSWGSSLATLPAVATDAITFRIGTVVYLAFATTVGYTYSSDGVAWTDDTQDTQYMTYWNDTLYGIASTGAMWKSTAIGTETTGQGQLPLPNGYVTDLFVARNAAGNPIIYASTKIGLYAHDATNLYWVETELKLPFHPNGGLGTTKWRDSIYMPAGLGVYRHINGTNSAVITINGPDRDFGLPSDKRGTIKQLLPSHNDLLAVVDSTTAPGTALAMFDGFAMGSHQAAVIQIDTGYSSILGWDEKGWETKWLSGSAAQAVTAAHVSNAYDTYRIWWAHNQLVYYMALPSDIINPNELTTFKYAASAEHITPWFNLGQIEVEKLALRLKVDATKMTANETVVVDYGLNQGTSWTNLGTITADGVTTYKFPDSTTPAGTAFRWIRFRLTLARGSTNTLTPHIHNLSLEWRKKLPVKWAFIATIDLTNEYKGNSPAQLRSALQTAISSSTLVEYTHRNDDGGTRNYYVDVIPIEGFEFTGMDERGAAVVRLEER